MEIAHEGCIRKCSVRLPRLSAKDLAYLSKKMESNRRKSSPNIVRKLWNCIKVIRGQRQIPNLDRIVRYMAREHNLTQEYTVTQLSYSVQEGLIRHTRSNGCRGSKTGIQQEAYRLPKVEIIRDSHDWYCWKCHKSGEVIKCSRCFRVYHPVCVEDVENIQNKFVCETCYDIFHDESENIIDRQELNRLLQYSCRRLSKILVLKKPLENFISSPMKDNSDMESGSESEGVQEVDLSNDDWQIDFLIFKYMDLKMMDNRLSQNKYANLESFRADAEIFFHNTIILFGADSKEAESVRYLVDECKRDIREILLCKDCFRESNIKSTEDWFCLPCDPHHELVYAKQKGYCFWPAKVIKVENENYDVRFFGGSHARAIVHKRNIRPITENIFSEVKRTVPWNRAYSELLKHQDYLLRQKQVQEIQNTFCNKRETLDSDVTPHYKLEKLELHSPQYNKMDVTEVYNSIGNKREPSDRETQVSHQRQDTELHSPLSYQLKLQERNSSCSGNSDSSMPYLFCEHSEKLESRSNGHHNTASDKNKSTSVIDDSPSLWKRQKKCRGVMSLQASRTVVSVNKDLSFDPNALQEEMGKFISEDVNGDSHAKETTSSMKSTKTLGMEDMEENANIETSQINTVMQKLHKLRENDEKIHEINYLKIKHARELAKCEKVIKKLKKELKEQQIKHQNEILKIKKEFWSPLGDIVQKLCGYSEGSNLTLACPVCFNRSRYYCCFNNAYCSPKCQTLHWKHHKHSCQHKEIHKT